ncbi:hypothetical protein [Cohnella xylanilytica]|uniref:hypothetical protein n=1 Tax=Cohnella xylanilytica TaxID=557555 RepID=UPI001BB41A86|nr:hypothetical protein [Cohnella xylanilytica]
MYNGFIGFISILILGGVIYAKLWWDGSGMSWKFTKWYSLLFVIAALAVGIGIWVTGSAI